MNFFDGDRPPLAQNLRKYLVSEDIERDEYIKNAPQSDDGYYLSPKVIDQK